MELSITTYCKIKKASYKNDEDKQQSITNMKRNTSKKRKAQPDALSEVVTSSNKKHNSANIVKLEEDASKNKGEPDNRDHAKKPFASNSNDNVISGTPLIILGHHHFDETSLTKKQ